MWLYIGIFFAVLLITGFIWLLQPYFSWRKNFSRQQAQHIQILTQQGTTLTRQDFMNQKRQKNYEFSLVVPSYNEQQRLPLMLEQACAHLQKVGKPYQVIIVNDGSKDKTTEVALKYGKLLKIDLYVVQYPKNRGKGGAVRCGMSVATGKYQLMVDADGATTFSEFDKVRQKMNAMQAEFHHPLIMVVGSRHHLSEQNKVERKVIRKFIAGVFKFLITIICGIKTKDTQCGFKLFTRQSASKLFETLHLERWAFDIQLFMICNKFKYQTAEVPVQWRDVDGSKLNVVEASISMLRDILLIRMLYLLRLWKFNDKVYIR